MNTEWNWVRPFSKREETAPVGLAPASTTIKANPAPSAAIAPIEEAPSRPSISRMAISIGERR